MVINETVMLNVCTNNSWKEQLREKDKKKIRVQKVRCLILLIRDPLDNHQVNISYMFADYFTQFMLVFVKFAKSVTTYKLIQK